LEGPTRSTQIPVSIAIRVIEVRNPPSFHNEKVTAYGGRKDREKGSLMVGWKLEWIERQNVRS